MVNNIEDREGLEQIIMDEIIEFVKSCSPYDLIAIHEQVMPESEEIRQLKELLNYD